MAKAGVGRSARSARSAKKWEFGLELGKTSFGGFETAGGTLGISSRDVKMAGVATRQMQLQTRMPTLSTRAGGVFGQTDVLIGTDFLQSVNTDSLGALDGDILVRALINPNAFARTRLSQFAPLYQRYRFRKLSFIWATTSSAFTNGGLIGFGDYDVDNLLTTDTPDNLNVAFAHMGQRVTQAWTVQEFPFGIVDKFTTLFTALGNEEARLIYQGVFYFIAEGTFLPNIELGKLYIDYEIEFNIPQLALDVVTRDLYCLKLAGSSTGSVGAGWDMLADTRSVESFYGIPSNIEWSYSAPTLTLENVPVGDYTLTLNASFGTSGKLDMNLAAAGMGPKILNLVGATILGSLLTVPADIDVTNSESFGKMTSTYVLNVATQGNVTLEAYFGDITSPSIAVLVSTILVSSLGDVTVSRGRGKSRYLKETIIERGHLLKSHGEHEVTTAELAYSEEKLDQSIEEKLKQLILNDKMEKKRRKATRKLNAQNNKKGKEKVKIIAISDTESD